jgi:uncharacterized membrane protein
MTMPAVMAMVGAFAGFTFGGASGAFHGALLGFIFTSVLEHRSRIRDLERSLEDFSPKAPALPPSPPPPPAAGPVRETPPPSAPPPRATPPPPPAFAAPVEREPDIFERAWSWAKPYFTGPSLFVTVGVVVLFFGVAFLLKYAVERELFPIELRLASAALGGAALLVLGWRTRTARPGFGLALQGGGVGILYLTVFAAFRLYALVPGAMAFALLFLFVALSAVLAVVQDSLALATLATVGGFLAPVLTSTGQGSHVALFSYYALLNAGILATAWFRSYRLLNLLGFLFTFVISASWGYRYYRPEYFATTEPFLIVFFLLYVAISVVFALRQAPGRNGIVDGTLVFGVPLATAVLQSALVRDYEYGMAWSALAFGAFYIALAVALLRYRPEVARDLGESFLGTGIVFATLAVPFAFENLVTSAFWALEGAAMVWVGARQRRLLPRVSGCALQVLAGLMFLVDPGPAGPQVVLNARFAGGVVIAIAGLATALFFHRRLERLRVEERLLLPVFFAWGLGWWLINGLHEVGAYAKTEDRVLGWALVFLSVTAAASIPLARRLAWPLLEKVSLGLLPSLAFAALYAALTLEHPFQGWAAAGWPIAVAAHLMVLRTRVLGAFWHAGGLWLVCLLTAWESSYLVHRAVSGAAWGDVMWGVVPLATILTLVALWRRIPRPYLTWGAAPVAAYLLLWVVTSSFSSTWDPNPLPYLPVLSPIDLTSLLALATLLLWLSRTTSFLEENGISRSAARAAIAGAAFLWMHGVVFRTVHFALGVPFEPEAMFDAVVVQTGIAVLWAMTGLGCMVAGTKRNLRPLWVAGAGLMGAVVIKLFVVDLSHTGTVARIVSFIGVGILLLVVGYFSPVPPRAAQEEPSAS